MGAWPCVSGWHRARALRAGPSAGRWGVGRYKEAASSLESNVDRRCDSGRGSWDGRRHGALVGMGMSSVLGVAIDVCMTDGPRIRLDLALLMAPAGFAFGALIFAFMRSRTGLEWLFLSPDRSAQHGGHVAECFGHSHSAEFFDGLGACLAAGLGDVEWIACRAVPGSVGGGVPQARSQAGSLRCSPKAGLCAMICRGSARAPIGSVSPIEYRSAELFQGRITDGEGIRVWR